MHASEPKSTDGALLSLQNVTRAFRMGEVSVVALRNVSMDVLRGEFLAIVGPSGSGKTTVLNLIGGLDQPNTGNVWFNDTNLAGADQPFLTRYRREEVGFVFQFYNLVPNLTARENVMVATDISENPLDADEVFELVGLADRQDHFPAQLSGGEQQRVAIARAIAKNPTLLLCDEPTGALDFETGKRVLRLLADLNKELSKTIIVITHNAALAQVADRRISLRSGEITDVADNPNPIAPEDVIW